MMLFKLSLRNIKKSFKDYAIYFFTLILGVAIFYIFNAIDSQTVLLDVTSSTKSIIDLMVNMLSGVSVFVSIILGFLVIYANRFLMKRRNKEFGIYLTLGMSKKKISLILLIETLVIGAISLIVGLLIGTLLSQVMSVFVANMFEADMTRFAFVFSTSATIKTLIYFGIIYLLVMIFNIVIVSKCRLIDLFQASRKSEKVKIKNPIVCILIFIVAVCMLSYAYYMVTVGVDDLALASDIFIPIALGCVSTFLIFWSLSGLLLRIIMSFKKFYYKGLNSFVLRQISSKINTTVASMSIICIMLFVTICVLSSSLSIKNSMTANLTTLVPADIEITKTLDMSVSDALDLGYNEEQAEDSKYSVRYSLEKLDFDVDKYFEDILDFQIYATNDVLIKDTLGAYYDEAKKTYPFLIYDTAETFIKLSDYNRLANRYGLEKISLNSDEYAIIADFDQWSAIRNEALKRGATLTLLGKEYHPKYDECINDFLYMTSNHINTGIFVVPDEAVSDAIREQNIFIADYKADTDEEKEDIEKMITELSDHDYATSTTLSASTKISIYEASIGLGALVTFIGLYLGLIFLISSAAILALKELSESTDNKERYNMLRKIGTDESMKNNALFKQIAVFFLIPLLLAIIHSIFGLEFCRYILETFGDEEMVKSITMTVIFLIIIYGGYFVITYICSKNIIKEGR